MNLPQLPKPPASPTPHDWNWATDAAGIAGHILGRIAEQDNGALHLRPNRGGWREVSPPSAAAHPTQYALANGRCGAIYSDHTALIRIRTHVLPFPLRITLPTGSPAQKAAHIGRSLQAASDRLDDWNGRIALDTPEATAA